MNEVKTIDVKEKFNDEIFLSVKRFCELKGISLTTFWRQRKVQKFDLKVTKIKGYGKKLFVVIKKESIIFINKENSIIL